MDIATGLGLVAGIIVIVTMVLMGGDLHMFISEHAMIIIFGGSFAATLIRFPLTAISHGLPLGAKFAFSMRRTTQRELVDEIAALAEIARKQGPIGLEKAETDATIWNAIATTSSPTSTRARRSTARSATARPPSA
jgi:chemotaxis protein MotA